jgi:hypothetical protein
MGCKQKEEHRKLGEEKEPYLNLTETHISISFTQLLLDGYLAIEVHQEKTYPAHRDFILNEIGDLKKIMISQLYLFYNLSFPPWFYPISALGR